MDSETAHDIFRDLAHLAELNPLTLKLLERFAYQGKRFKDERLNVVIGEITFENPLLVGAGWDKKGKAVQALWQLGFGGVEVGSICEFPQEGNDKPRQWFFENCAAMNRLGFNSPGMEAVAKNLEKYLGGQIPVGISIGVNKSILEKGPEEVFKSQAEITKRLYGYADYFALNPASPNTPGLRRYQEKELLLESIKAVTEGMLANGRLKPLLIKIAPDLSTKQIDDVIEVVLDCNLTGIIATNTTNSNLIKFKYGKAGELGGISGNDSDFRAMATNIIKHIYKESGDQVEIIGVGGVNSAETAWEKIAAGARALQIVTAIREVGPTLPGRINSGLIEKMEKEGVDSLEEIRGSHSS
jgi:dihydroorotate dehydrogenase